MVIAEPSLAYLDASAIVKLAVEERETEALVASLGEAKLATSEISLIEVPRAAHLRTGSVDTIARAEALLQRFDLVVIDEELRRAAAHLGPPELRTLDSIHLASLFRLRGRVDRAVIYDLRLARAARDAGFSVEAPGQQEELVNGYI